MILPCYLNGIYVHILHHLQAMKMIFLKLFLSCTFKDPNLAENLKNLAIFFFFNLTSQSSWSLFFPSLDSEPVKRTARAAGA